MNLLRNSEEKSKLELGRVMDAFSAVYAMVFHQVHQVTSLPVTLLFRGPRATQYRRINACINCKGSDKCEGLQKDSTPSYSHLQMENVYSNSFLPYKMLTAGVQ